MAGGVIQARPHTGLLHALLLMLAVAACAHPAVRPDGTEPPSGPEIGLASFYGREFRGRRTASGDRYDPKAMTCAHRTYPFGTLLLVTDLETERDVTVSVNDRGPFTRGRIVDLSRAAAVKLGIVARGVVRVRVERAK